MDLFTASLRGYFVNSMNLLTRQFASKHESTDCRALGVRCSFNTTYVPNNLNGADKSKARKRHGLKVIYIRNRMSSI
jgi:hypothetical protein